MISDEDFPVDLIIDIFSRLPAKSVARCRFVSKLWESLFLRPDCTEFFLNKSTPRLLFAVKKSDDLCFLTSPQRQNLDETSPLHLTADIHMKFTEGTSVEFRGHASGFIHFCRYVRILEDTVRVLGLCNPSTGQYLNLPLPKLGRIGWRSFLGFDPIDKQFKVLFINEEKEECDQIMTLGSSWRKIHCPLNLVPRGEGICIDGVLYYLATRNRCDWMIVCFDVRSEKYKFINADFICHRHKTKLINHKGKLGVFILDYGVSQHPNRRHCVNLCIWVIKDVENPESEWSKHLSFCWDDDEVVDNSDFSIVGVTAIGDIVLSKYSAYDPFYVFYINLERNTIQSVGIQGVCLNHFVNLCRGVEVFVDYVEDLQFINMISSSISPPPEPMKRKPASTSRSSRVYQLQQDGRIKLENINRIHSLSRLEYDDNEFSSMCSLLPS